MTQVRSSLNASTSYVSTSRLSPIRSASLYLRIRTDHSSGAWALPGGHLDLGESFEDCAVREVLEETGIILKPKNVRFLTATNDFVDEDRKHYVTIFMGYSLPVPTEEENGARLEPQIGFEPRNMEPEKCEGWEWVQWEDLAAWGQEDSSINDVSNAANNATGKVKGGKSDGQWLSVPLLNLLNQRPGFDPLQSYRVAGTRHRAMGDADQ